MNDDLALPRPRRQVRPIDALLLLGGSFYLLLIADRAVVFGSHAGRWVFPYVRELTATPVLVGLGLAAPALLAWHLGARWIERRPVPVLGAWFVALFLLQAALHALYPVGMEALVRSDVCNSFYGASLRVGPAELLARFTEVAPRLPLHAHNNLPGKTFLYYFLELFTRSPRTLGFALMALSNVGGLLLFVVVRRVLGDARVALLAATLAMLMPAQVGFFPLLNTVTPVFILFPLALLLAWIARPRPWLAAALGASLYLLVFFEAQPLVLGLVFVALLGAALARGQLAWRPLWQVAVLAPAAFLGVAAGMRLLFGFDLLEAFLFVYRDNANFNVVAGRPYDLWLVHNLKEFFANLGILSALLVALFFQAFVRALFAAWGGAAEGRGARVSEVLLEPAHVLGAALIVTLLVHDATGIIRGEVTRQWIFLAVPFQAVAAFTAVRMLGGGASYLVIGWTLLQTAVTTATVGFALP